MRAKLQLLAVFMGRDLNLKKVGVKPTRRLINGKNG